MRDLAHINIVTDGGPWADHNMPCSVCGARAAVIQLWNGQFQPCWECQARGYMTVKVPRWVGKILNHFFLGKVK